MAKWAAEATVTVVLAVTVAVAVVAAPARAVRSREAVGVRGPDLLRDRAVEVVLLQPARAGEGRVLLPVRERPDVRVLHQ
ncbi:hypothetical protein EE612_052189 [Oryza sativa]|nr:hypothetical protein EE612_052189 [Oryza sativa]